MRTGRPIKRASVYGYRFLFGKRKREREVEEVINYVGAKQAVE